MKPSFLVPSLLPSTLFVPCNHVISIGLSTVPVFLPSFLLSFLPCSFHVPCTLLLTILASYMSYAPSLYVPYTFLLSFFPSFLPCSFPSFLVPSFIHSSHVPCSYLYSNFPSMFLPSILLLSIAPSLLTLFFYFSIFLTAWFHTVSILLTTHDLDSFNWVT